MADFKVTVERVRAIEEIPGADSIELAVIGEYRSVVQKDKFKAGELAVYIPEQSVLPEWLIERMGLTGRLSGGKKNRVKAIKLRGCLSQGLIYPVIVASTWTNDSYGIEEETVISCENVAEIVNEGDDVTEFLDIKKYDPTEDMDENQRRRMHGECAYIPGKTVKYDLENWKKYPTLFEEGEHVYITEKLHGTMCCLAYHPTLNHEEFLDSEFAYSKGLGASGQVFKRNEANEKNLYVRTMMHYKGTDGTWPGLARQVHRALWLSDRIEVITPVYVFGEVFGANVQDMNYGLSEPEFRAFDVWVGSPEFGVFLTPEEKYQVFDDLEIEYVPVLYKGPYSKEKLLELTDGTTALEGGTHVREGVVVTASSGVEVYRFGRKILKSVSADYLLRKGKTTEFS